MSWICQVESLQNLSKTLAKQNDLEILEDRIQKALEMLVEATWTYTV